MTVYLPSLVVDFRLVFDEELTVTVSIPSPSTVEGNVKGASGFGVPVTQPLVSGRGVQSQVLARVPKAANVALPGHRPAGTFNLTFDFIEMPIDPRTVKSAAVDIYLGTVSQADFAEGMSGRSKRSVLDRSTLEPLLTGIVDEWEVTHGEDGSEIQISGRDLRGFLLDTPIATNPKQTGKLLDSVNMLLPIDQVIVQVLSFHPLAAGIKVSANPGEWDTGMLPAPYGTGGFGAGRHRKGAKGDKLGGRLGTAGSQERVMFWDLIVKLCYMVGAIPHFVGTTLRIRPARSLYDRKFAGFDPLIPTPFEGGAPRAIDAVTGTTITPLSIRRMVYGRDIEEFKFRRKFGGYMRPRQVCCVSLDDTTPLKRGADRQLVGRYPDAEIATKVAASGQKSMSEQLWIRAPAGICDVEQLTMIAKAVYNEIGRGEISGTCKTKALASFGGDNNDADLLRLRPGDAVEFGTDVRQLRPVAPLVADYVDHLRTSFEKQVDAIAARIGDKNLARVILATSSGQVNLQSFFRVEGVHFDWSEEGLGVSFDFQNFIEASFEQDESRPVPMTPTTTTVPDQELGGL